MWQERLNKVIWHLYEVFLLGQLRAVGRISAVPPKQQQQQPPGAGNNNNLILSEAVVWKLLLCPSTQYQTFYFTFGEGGRWGEEVKRKRSSKGLQRAQQRLKILFFSRRRIRIPREEVSKDHKEDVTERYIRQGQRRGRPSLPLVTPPQKHSPIMMWSEGPALSSLVQLSLKNSCHRNSKTIDVSMLNKKMKRRLIHNICLSSGIPSRIGFYHLIVMDHCHLNRAYYLLLHADFPFVRQ